MASEMDYYIRRERRRIEKAERREAKRQKNSAAFRKNQLDSHYKLAVQFILWTRRAGIKPARLPSTVKWRNSERISGWVVDQHVYRGEVLSYKAVTTQGQYVTVDAYRGIAEELYGMMQEDIAKFIATHQPDVPWDEDEHAKKRFCLFG